ncbi:MAG: hypothetical protein RJA70_4537 [Pseudomonadota bacterium]|jgi:uncharacterized membrane protein
MKLLATNFFRGLVLVVPIAATFWVLYAAFRFIDSMLPVPLPGVGFLIIVGAVTLLGAASPFLLGTPLSSLARGLLDKLPLVKLIYGAVSDLMAAFVGDKQSFREPVLVTINRENGLKKVGFITQRDLSRLGLSGQVAVYLPHSYNFSGNLFIVPADSVEPLNVTGTEAMKFIVSGGVTDVGSD